MPDELTPEEKLMDTDGNKKVSKKERKAFKQQAPETVAGKWGISYALINQLKSGDALAQDFYNWFQSKVSQYISNPTGFSDRAFIIEFDQQPWAQKYKSDAIKDMDFEARFPELYADQLDAEVETLRDQIMEFGVEVDETELRDLAKQKRRFGMNEAQIRNTLADLATAKTNVFRGETGQIQRGIQEWSRRNGLALTDNLINDYVRKIQMGDMTQDDVLQDLRRTYMAGAYPAWSDRIDAGYDIFDIAAPYRSVIAKGLEQAEDTITLDDPLMKKIFQAVGPDGKPVVVPIYEAERMVREDPRWPKTDNAYRTYSEVADSVLDMFGFR